MNRFIAIAIIILVLPIIVFNVRISIKIMKERFIEDKRSYNKIKRWSRRPKNELSLMQIGITGFVILIINVIAVIFSLPYLLYFIGKIGLYIYLGLVVLNIYLLRYAYDQGKWLSKYNWKRIFFFIPIIGGFILLSVSVIRKRLI